MYIYIYIYNIYIIYIYKHIYIYISVCEYVCVRLRETRSFVMQLPREIGNLSDQKQFFLQEEFCWQNVAVVEVAGKLFRAPKFVFKSPKLIDQKLLLYAIFEKLKIEVTLF